MNNQKIAGLQVNYKNYFIKAEKEQDGIKVYHLEFNTNDYTLIDDGKEYELVDQNKKILEYGSSGTIKWLVADIRPDVQ